MSTVAQATHGGKDPLHWMKVHLLEGDGVVPHLFQYLFRMDRALRGRHHAEATVTEGGSATCALPIPDTVVYTNNFPHAWFRYRDGEIVKRPGKYLDAQHIYRGLCRVEPNSGGICAQFCCALHVPGRSTSASASTSNAGPGGSASNPTSSAVEGDTSSMARVYYLDPPALQELLYGRGAMATVVKHGILQKFIPPRGSCNDMIEVVWSPKLSITRRRVNRFSIASRSVAIDVRGATFDGLPHHSLESAANERVTQQLTTMIASVAEHLLRHEHKTVSRFAALFKQDKYCRLWLCYATSIRVESDQLIGATIQRLPINLNPQYQRPATTVSTEYIEQQRKRHVTLDFRPHRPATASAAPRFRFHPNALARSPSKPLEPRDGSARRAALRDRLVGERLESATDAHEAEFRQLQAFVDDALYTLYASRMTVAGQPKVAALVVPTAVSQLLGPQYLDQLLVGIMQLKQVPHARAGASGLVYASTPADADGHDEVAAPIWSIKERCEAFLSDFHQLARTP